MVLENFKETSHYDERGCCEFTTSLKLNGSFGGYHDVDSVWVELASYDPGDDVSTEGFESSGFRLE